MNLTRGRPLQLLLCWRSEIFPWSLPEGISNEPEIIAAFVIFSFSCPWNT